MKLRNYRSAVVLALAFAVANCAANRTPEGVVAEYGVKIGNTVKAAQDAVSAVGTAPSASPGVREGALAALKGLNIVNDKGLKLAGVLDQISAARKAGEVISPGSLDEALKLLSDIDEEILLRIVPQLGAHPETAASLTAVREISRLVLTIQFGLGKGTV